MLKLLARIGSAAFQGDDGLLKAMVRVVEEDGFTVLPPRPSSRTRCRLPGC